MMKNILDFFKTKITAVIVVLITMLLVLALGGIAYALDHFDTAFVFYKYAFILLAVYLILQFYFLNHNLLDKRFIARRFIIKVEYLRDHFGITKATIGSNAYDCKLLISSITKEILGDNFEYCRGFSIARLKDSHYLIIKPNGKVLIPLGIKFNLPEGIHCKVLPKSGIGLKSDLIIPNSPGLIDTDYRGEVMLILTNMGNKSVELRDDSNVCQLLFEISPIVTFVYDAVLEDTDRGAGGHGSTGSVLDNH